MESLTVSYKNLFLSPPAVASAPDFLRETLLLLLVGLIAGWFLTHGAKTLIDGKQFGISNRDRLAACWAAILLAALALILMSVLLVLDRVPDWTAVSPHAAFAFLMGLIALIFMMGTRADLRQHRIYVETARKQGI